MAIRKAVDGLPDQHRILVVLCDFEGRSYDEAASILGINIGTVRSRLARARDTLKKRLDGLL